MKSGEMKGLSLSRFLCVFERDGLVALVHKLKPEPIYLLKKDWNDLTLSIAKKEYPNSGVVSELVMRNLFIDDCAVDSQMLGIVRRQILQSFNRPTILYLMMAQGCNFACSYCPIPALAKQYGERLLSFEDAIAGIALWQKHIEDQPQDDDPYFLIFYGGEPLLNREVLERLLPYVAREQTAGRLPKKLELMFCTNGSLIDERISKLFACHRVTVAVGVDGPRDHNDSIRITSDSGPTFAVIKNSIKQLINNGVRVVASVMITPANVYCLAEYPDFLRGLGISKFGFNLMKGRVLIRELSDGSMEDYCRAAARGVLQGLTRLDKEDQHYEYQLGKKLTALRKGLPFSVDCTCYGNQLVIQADGQVSNCPFLRIDQGHIRTLSDTFRIGKTEVVKRWRHRIPLLSNPVIEDDNNGVLDGGGCAWSSSELCGDIAARDTNNAIFTKEIINELVWTLLPGDQASAIHQGKTTHWGYRRVGSLCVAGVECI